MRTLALALPQGYEYCRMIRQGVVAEIEAAGGWQVLQLPVHPSGRIPVPRGMESLDGIVAWTEEHHRWMKTLAGKGIPIVNCGGDWRDAPDIANIVVDLTSVLQLAIAHFKDLSLSRVLYFGHRISSDPRRRGAMMALARIAGKEGIGVEGIETRGKNPDENLERLLTPEREHRLIRQFATLEGSLGMLCENDYFARIACNIAAAAGKRVPHDLAVLGTTGDLLGRFGSPTISTIPFPGVEIGRTAFRIINDARQGVPISGKPVQIAATSIIVRESTGGKAGDIAMERVFRKIEAEAHRGLTVQELATVAAMSLKTLRRRYMSVHGEEPSDHIRRLRMAKLKEMLATTDDPIADIAARGGFTSQAAFYNYFLRHEQVSPSEYRKRAEMAGQ